MPKKPAAKKPAAKKPAAKKPAAKKPSGKSEPSQPDKKETLPGNNEPTKEEQTAAEKADKRAREENEGRARLHKEMDRKRLFYDSSGTFWFKPAARFLAMPSARIKDHLRKTAGLRETREGPYVDGIKEIDWMFTWAETERVVDYAGPLAGHRVGIYESGGLRYLVTTEAKGVWDQLPAPRFPDLFGPLIQALLPGFQWRHFCYWLALAFRSLRNCDFRPGQAVFLCGPPNCGKSLLQLIVTMIFGGRSANPIDWLTGETEFNNDCIGSELWAFDDPRTTNEYRDRERFGERLKEGTNNDKIRARGMYSDAALVRIFRRIMGGLQDSATHVARIPPLIEGTRDKVNVYHCADARKTLDGFIVREEQRVFSEFGEPIPVGQQDRLAIYRWFEQETPLIRSWLLHEFKHVPDDWREDRMGVRAYHHPELVELIHSLSPAAILLSVFDLHAWDQRDENDRCPITGTSAKILSIYKDQLSGVARTPNHLGKLLSDLVDQKPDRVSKRKSGGDWIYAVKAPPETTDEKQEGDPY